jgi:hypothetical protein
LSGATPTANSRTVRDDMRNLMGNWEKILRVRTEY